MLPPGSRVVGRCQGRRDATRLSACKICVTLNLADPMQNPAGREGTGRGQVDPTNHRPCQIRARYSGDPRGATGSHGDTDRHFSTNTPDLSSQVRGRFGWCGGSRIRTLEGISRRIYRLLARETMPEALTVQRTSTGAPATCIAALMRQMVGHRVGLPRRVAGPGRCCSAGEQNL